MDQEQHELYENARSRIKQKKRLYFHFVLFLVGSVFLIIINKVLNYGDTYDWFVWAITLWSFFFIFHVINVFIINPFMGKDWERKQTERLIQKQELKIAKMEREIEKEARLKAESEAFAEELKKKEIPPHNNQENI